MSKLSNPKLPLYISLAVALLALGGVVAYTALKTGSGVPSDGEEERNFFPFIPIWIAIFVPLIANKRKEQKPLTKKEQTLTYIVLGITVALVIGTVLLLVFLN